MRTTQSLLVEATQKLIELQSHPEWKSQLPIRCPPVLWFGNKNSPKQKILTLGANPSRREFLRDNAARAIDKVGLCADQSLLTYLEQPDNRFHLLRTGAQMAEILASESLQDQIIAGYNAYFSKNPYSGWFGHDRNDSYKVEGFLRGFGASYYDGNAIPLQAIHIDLFPFVTFEDFSQIKGIADVALFADRWAQLLVSGLVETLLPAVLLVFGRTNCDYFAQYIDPSLSDMAWKECLAGKYFVGHSERFRVPVVGLSTNLGNPKGFTAATLRQFGEKVRSAVQKIGIDLTA
jgi:hypothetical protein